MAVDGIQIRGDKELIAKLQNLSKKGAKAACRKATRKGANVILKEARARAPVGPTGNFKKGIKLKPKTTGNIVSTWVRATAPHSALLEYGTKDRKTKAGKSTGKMPVSHFMQLVAKDTGPEALEVTKQSLGILIEQAARGDGTGGV